LAVYRVKLAKKPTEGKFLGQRESHCHISNNLVLPEYFLDKAFQGGFLMVRDLLSLANTNIQTPIACKHITFTKHPFYNLIYTSEHKNSGQKNSFFQ
jgi:hypothetical protein